MGVTRHYVFVIGLLLGVQCSFASRLDPALGVFDAELFVTYHQLDDGIWKYTYKVVNSATDQVLDFVNIDISCKLIPIEDVDKNIYSYGPNGKEPTPISVFEQDYGQRPLPVEILAADGDVRFMGINLGAEAYWSTKLRPGEAYDGLILRSTYPPGMRMYTLEPEVVYVEPAEDVPEIGDDENVYGMIPGPGCPGVSPSVETPIYPGSVPMGAGDELNTLLTYPGILKNMLSSASGEKIRFTIRYSEDIDSSTFNVTPAWLKSLFNPTPGTEQEILVPIRSKYIQMKLSVESKADEQSKRGRKRHLYTDVDVFTVNAEKNDSRK